jgi:hypothetical protein
MTDQRCWAEAAVRLAQQLLCVLYVAVAAVGVLVTPTGVMLTAAPAVAVLATGLFVGVFRFWQQRHPSRRQVMITAAAAAAILPFHEGVELLQGLGTAVAATVLVLVTIVGNYRVSTLDVPVPAGATRPGGATSYAELLRVMSLDTVLSEWRALGHGVGLPSGQHHRPDVSQLRALLLDEMQRRDPAGFRRWLDDGAEDDPAEHIDGDQDLAT